jgi:hypothetical protein
MTNRKGFGRSGFGLIGVLFQYLPDCTNKNHENFSQDVWCANQNFNEGPPECKTRALLLDKPAW